MNEISVTRKARVGPIGQHAGLLLVPFVSGEKSYFASFSGITTT
jgi:hypothetical protein